MKKTFVTALVVGSCMLASETASAQDSVSSLLAFSPEAQEARDAENRRRMLGSKNKNRQDTGGDENAENAEKEPADEEPQDQEEQEREEQEEQEKEDEEEQEKEEQEEQEKEEQEEQEKEEQEEQEKEDEEAQEKEDQEEQEKEDQEEQEKEEQEEQEKEEQEEQEKEEQEEQEKEEEEEQEPEEKEQDEEQEPEEKEEGEGKENANDGEERQYDDDGREVDEDGNPKVQEESVGPGGEEMVDDDDTDPNGEAREQAQEEREQNQEEAAGERDEANDEAAQEKEDAEAEQQDQAEAQENDQAEAEEKEQADQQEADEQEEKDDAAAQEEKEEADEQEEAEEKEQAETDEKEQADQEEQEQAEADEKEEADAQEQQEADDQEAQEKEEADAQEKEDAEAEEQEQAEADEKEEAEADQKEQEEADEKEEADAEEKEQDEADDKEQEEADDKEQEEADDKEQEEADDKEQEEADDKEQAEADDKEQEEADDQEQAEADEKEEAEQEENEQAEAEEKEGQGEGEEKEGGEGEEREPEEREEGEGREPAEGEEREDDGEGRGRVEEESVGPADDSSAASGPAKGKSANGQYEGDVVQFDEENDPEWYRAHMSTYPCYKLTEGALFNFQLLKNLDQDWHTAGADTKKPSQVYFNLCHYTDTSDCSGNKEDAFAYRTDETGNCEMLTSDSPQAEITEEVTRQNPSDPDSEQRGVRIMRAGGDDCPADSSRLLQFTLDVWCNEDVSRNPSGIKSVSMAPDDDEADPCTIYVNLEHAAGCPELDFEPALNMLGVIMIFFGVTLQYFGRRVQRLFMRILVSIATFLIVLGICFKLNWLALFDPTEPDSNKSVFLAMFSILLACVAVTIINFLFKKFLRLAPTFIGLCAGFWFSIYLIAAVNGIGGMFVPAAAAGSKDVIGPVWGAVIEFMVSCLGGLIGYNYSAVFILFIQTFVSAYMIVRGSTLIINLGFPNEIVLMQSVSNETNGLVRLPTSFYLYSATILGLWGGSFYFQLSKEWEDGTLTKFDDDDD